METTLDTDLPFRLDRLPWSRWHWRVVVALGITWILDGLEVTIVGSIAGVLHQPETLAFTESQIGASASAYLSGAILGALIFGRLSDQWGRKRLFLITLGIYSVFTFLTAFSWNFLSFAIFRALTGMGIGGECSAMNSAIDELLPARVRGQADLTINGTYWLGTALGAASSLVLLNPAVFSIAIGWRLAFGIGAVLGACILLIRQSIPESPRWLIRRGCVKEAKKIIDAIEKEVSDEKGPLPPVLHRASVETSGPATFSGIIRILFKSHRRRTFLGMTLMISQAFIYNAIFFTYALVLGRFYAVPAEQIGYYIFPFAIGNLAGPILLGRLFDVVGRKIMISVTYAIAAFLLMATAYGFLNEWLTAFSQTALWCAVFFFASTAASSAYLTVSELFPVEVRGLAIAVFYAVGTGVGGVAAPALFGFLIESGSRYQVFLGYSLGAFLMLFAAGIALVLGVSSERKSLEQINMLKDVQ